MEKTGEFWKDIPNYEGLYQASTLGKIKSLQRKDSLNRLIPERILAPIYKNRRYYKVTLCDNKKHKDYNIHQLIAITFLNHKPSGMKLVVNHINFDRTDNRLINLEIITNRDNSNKAHIKSSSKYIGVSFKKSENKWISRIYKNGKSNHLGRFKTELEAHIAYQNELTS